MGQRTFLIWKTVNKQNNSGQGRKYFMENMLIETGVVLEKRPDGTALIECQRGSMCLHCVAADSCNAGSSGGTMQIEAINKKDAAVGDLVRVATTAKKFLGSSFLVYIVPIIALLTGAVLGENLAERLWPQTDADLAAAVLGVVFLIVSFLLIRIKNYSLSKNKYLPHVIAIVAHEEGGN